MDFLHLVKKLNNVKLLSFVLIIIPLILFLKAKQNTNITIGLVVPVLLLGVYLAKRSSSSVVYLVDFACYKPGKERKAINETIMKKMEECGLYNENTIEFQHRILRKSGFGDETYLPAQALTFEPLNHSVEEARLEVETVIFGVLDALFAKTNVEPNVIDILVVNCSLFNPVPSISAMIVNHYNLRNNMKSFNLGGMGCSAGMISINLAKEILNANPDSCAVVVSTETLTHNWYNGNDRSMLLSNCIFRMGGAAILLSNKSSDRTRSKYKLLHTIRTHSGANDKNYNCVFQREDETGYTGVSLSKELTKVAGEALKNNITELGPLVLPFSEQLMFMISLFRKKSSNYVPNFKLAFEHFCIHAGGRSVLDAMENNLQLSEWHMEPSRSTLPRFGNTSSSSLWYELAYVEAKGRVSKGDRVWQIAFGAGFKCNSSVWRACRDIPVLHDLTGNPWDDSVNNYPIDFSTI